VFQTLPSPWDTLTRDGAPTQTPLDSPLSGRLIAPVPRDTLTWAIPYTLAPCFGQTEVEQCALLVDQVKQCTDEVQRLEVHKADVHRPEVRGADVHRPEVRGAMYIDLKCAEPMYKVHKRTA
jgi:hypothetical protein